MKNALEIRNMKFSYRDKNVLKDLSLFLKPKLNVIIGPNAAGKSTLLKCVFGILKYEGDIFINNINRKKIPRYELNKLIGYLPQDTFSNSTLTVFESVLLGKINDLALRVKKDDLVDIMDLLKELGISDIAKSKLNELSGGQRQVVSIAQLMIRKPQIIIMDEPTNNLDMQNQLEIITLIKSITVNNQINSIIILHDLNLTARYADEVIVLDGNGGVYAQGKPRDVITKEMIRNVYGVHAEISYDKLGIPTVTPIKSTRKSVIMDLRIIDEKIM